MERQERRMIRKVMALMEQFHMVQEGDTIVVGVSGGADSVCLLHLLWEYGKRVPISLVAVHVNHKIRKEAAEDAAFVERLCEAMGLPFFCMKRRWKNGRQKKKFLPRRQDERRDMRHLRKPCSNMETAKLQLRTIRVT